MQIKSIMDPIPTECEDSNIKVEVKEEPDFVYIDESVCRVKLEENDGDLVLPKEEETEKIVADVGLYGSQLTSREVQSSCNRGRRRKIVNVHKTESSTYGAARKILPRPQMHVPNLKITHATLPISSLQPTTLHSSKQISEPLPEQQSSFTQNAPIKTSSPQVAACAAGTGRKILPRPHLPASLVHSQQQTVPIQQLQNINTSNKHQTIPLNQLHSVNSANNCNIMPIHQLQHTLPGTNHSPLSVPQLKSTLGPTQRAVSISPKKSVIATVPKKSIPLSRLKSASRVSSTGITLAPHLQSTPPDATKKIGHIQQKQSANPGNGRKLLPRPQQSSVGPPSRMIIQQKQHSISLQHLQPVSSSTNHQTVPLQQMQSIPVSSSQQALPIHHLQKICPVSTPQNISLQQIQTLNAVTTQQNMSLQPLQNTPVSTQQSLSLQPLQALTSVSSHQSMQLQTMPSGNSHQTVPVQQLQTVPSGSSQQAMPVQQVQTISSGNSQPTLPVQQIQTIPPGSSQQTVPVQQVQTLQSERSQKSLPVHQVQTIPSGSSHQTMPVQQLQSLMPGSSQQTMPVQHLQALPSGNSHQYMPIQQLQQLRALTPATQHQTIPLQSMQTIQSACQHQGIPLQQLQPIAPATTQIMPVQQYNNNHSSIPLQQIQTIPHASNHQTVPFQQLSSVTPGISQHTVSLQQLQSIPQPDGHQPLSVQQMQPIGQGSTQDPMQHVKPLPSASVQQAPVHYVQSVSSNTNLMSVQQLRPRRLNDSNKSMQVQPIPSPNQSQTTVHFQQHLQSTASSDAHQGTSIHPVHPITRSKTQLKVPIHPIKTTTPVTRSKMKLLRQSSVTSSASKTQSILNVGSVTVHAVKKNRKTRQKKLSIRDTSDKAVPIVPGRKILPRPLLLTTPSKCDIQSVKLENFHPITSTTNCTILSKHQMQSETLDNVCRTIVIPPVKSSVDVSLQNALSIPELQSTTSSFLHRSIPIKQLQPLVSQQTAAAITDSQSSAIQLPASATITDSQSSAIQLPASATITDSQSSAIQLPASATTVTCNFVPSSEQKSDMGEKNYIAQSSWKLTCSSELVNPETKTDPDQQDMTCIPSQSLPSPESESPTQDANGALSPGHEQETSVADTGSEGPSSPSEEVAVSDDCTEGVSVSRLEMVTAESADVSKQTLHHTGTVSATSECDDSSLQNCDKIQMKIVCKPQVPHSPSASSEPSFDSQGNFDVSHFKSKSLPASPEEYASEKYVTSLSEQMRSDSMHGSIHRNQHYSTIPTISHLHPQECLSPARTDEYPYAQEDKDDTVTANESECILQEMHEKDRIDGSLNNPQFKDIAPHAPNDMKPLTEQQLDALNNANGDAVMQEHCQALDTSSDFSSAHLQHFSSTVDVSSHPRQICSAVGTVNESLPSGSKRYVVTYATDDSQPSFKQECITPESSDDCVQTQPEHSPLFFSEDNTALNYTAEIKPELQVDYANTLEDAETSHELQYDDNQVFHHPKIEGGNHGNSDEQEQSSSPCLQVSSEQQINSSMYSASCSCIPASGLQQSVTQVSNNGCWINTQALHHPKVEEAPSDFHCPPVSIKDENTEIDKENPDISDSPRLPLKECPDDLKNQEEPVEEASCEELLGQKCSRTYVQSQSSHCSHLKKCHVRKKSRALVELCKMKDIMLSQKNTIRALWKKLKFERRKNKRLREKLKSRDAKTDNLNDYESPASNGVTENPPFDALKDLNDGVCGEPVNKRKYEEETPKLTKRHNNAHDDAGADSGVAVPDDDSGSELQCLIHKFMMRDDISRAGRRTPARHESGNPVRYRLHYLPVLHKRFMADCCRHCSYQTFRRHVPRNVLKCRADELESCLCMTCQNPELKIESMVKRRFLSLSTDIEEVIDSEEAYEVLVRSLGPLKSRHAPLTYSAWSVAACGGRSPVPQKRALTRSLGEVAQSLEGELRSLRDHIRRTCLQYEAAYRAKCEAKSLFDHAVIQTDWSPLIILHSVSENGVPEPQRVVSLQCGYTWSLLDSMGFLALSDSKDRTAPAVCASLERVFDRLISNGTKTLTFIVDPQTHVAGIREYAQRRDIGASWIFVEPGHGCGMSEAVGNSISQLICDTINANGISVIRTARDVFHLISPHSNNFIYFYTDGDVRRHRELVNSDVPKNGNKLIKPKMLVPLHISDP